MPDPRVVGVWIALPVHEVLQLTSSPLASGVEDCFYLVFFLIIDDQRGACEGHAICVAGFARATPPQEGIIRETPKSTQPSPKTKLQPDSEDKEAPT